MVSMERYSVTARLPWGAHSWDGSGRTSLYGCILFTRSSAPDLPIGMISNTFCLMVILQRNNCRLVLANVAGLSANIMYGVTMLAVKLVKNSLRMCKRTYLRQR